MNNLEKISVGRYDSLNASNGLWKQSNYDGYCGWFEINTSYQAAFVKKVNGVYFVGLSCDPEDTIPIPEGLAKIVIVGIIAESIFRKRRPKNEGSYSDLKHYGRLFIALYKKFNCHKTMAVALGIHPDISSGSWQVKELETRNDPKFLFKKFDDLVAQIEVISSFPIAARIHGTEAGLHSFVILGKLRTGEYLCFEKVGVGSFPIRIVSLETIYTKFSYHPYSLFNI